MSAEPTIPAETPLGDYIEAALHALRANRPELATRYLTEATTPATLRAVMLAGESNDRG